MGGTWEQETLHAGPLTLPPSSIHPAPSHFTQAVAKLQKLREQRGKSLWQRRRGALFCEVSNTDLSGEF